MIINRMPVLALWIVLVASLGTGVTDSMSAPAIQGTASVIDGDTIEIRGERLRLDAIDAPESSQLCLDAAGKRYRCGLSTPEQDWAVGRRKSRPPGPWGKVPARGTAASQPRPQEAGG